MNSTGESSTGNSKQKEDKPQKRARKTSRFRKLSISRGRASFSKDKHNSDELQHLLTATENNGEEVEQEQTERRKVEVPTIDEIELKEVPVYIICPKCGEKGITTTETKRSKEAVLVALCLCLLQCYCCCWIPLVMKRLKQVNHTCPHCMQQIGVYKQHTFLSKFKKSANDEAPSQ